MDQFTKNIRPFVAHEIDQARLQQANPKRSFSHLERAHVLGQTSTSQHVLVHVKMLLWALRHKDPREVLGQLFRIVGAATKTALGWVPTGNTGGSNISPFKSLAIPTDLAAVIETAKSRSF